MKVSKKNIFPEVILFCLFINTAIIHWLYLQYNFRYIIDILILLYFVKKNKLISKYHTLIIPFLVTTIIYPVINYYLHGGSVRMLFANINDLITPLLIILFYAIIINENPVFISNYFRNNIMSFNILYILNIPVILLEWMGYTDLAGRHPLFNTNTYAPDLISGLFGYNGTPMLALYSCFLIFYNFIVSKCIREKGKKEKYKFYFFTWVIVSSMISTINDNKAYFVILVMYYLLFWISHNRIENKLSRKLKTVFKILGLSSVLSLLLFLLYKNSVLFSNLVSNLISAFINGIDYQKSYGSGVRIGVILQFLNSSPKKWFGYGLGRFAWAESNMLEYKNFGQGNMSSFIVLGGVVYVIIILWFLYNVLYALFKDRVIAVSFLLMFIAVAIFTQVFTVTSSATSLIMFCAVVKIYIDEKRKINYQET